tara:strand:- start:1994 stop:3157 length:1164 start_codon:yes stop_codon:yes gene_type:complete
MKYFPKKLMLLGSGELGKEIIICAKRLGCNVIACDRYERAPGMQVADKYEVFDMTDPIKLKSIIKKHNPDYVIPEIEALAVDALIELEKEGINIIPNARAAAITMNRDRIRDLASKTLNMKTAKYAYAECYSDAENAISKIGLPAVIKPIMSSSGKGQSLVRNHDEMHKAWNYAKEGARGSSSKIIIEEFINFDSEITLLTIRQNEKSTLFCEPIGHEQKDGDYQCSWQPAELNQDQINKAKSMAIKITDNLGGKGLFGVEFFIKGKDVIFSEVSPRPHDTGLVTLISQNLSEFELHLRAILDLPIPSITINKPSASKVITASNNIESASYKGLEHALSFNESNVLIFGKEKARKGRRMGVALSLGKDINEAVESAKKIASSIEVIS